MTSKNLGRTAATLLLLSTALPAYAADVPVEDEIIVTGSPLVRSVDEAITGVSVLSGDELLDRIAGTIGETLKSEPGVSSTFFGAGASRPIIRGQGGDRVRVLTNGIGSIDASSASPDHAVAAEPAQAERIEVLRGASLLRYGSSGSGGIVNVIDGRIPDRMPDGVEGALRIGASSVDLGREVAGSIDTAIAPNIAVHFDGTWHKSDNYQIPGEAESAIFHAFEHEDEEDHDDHDEDDHDDDDHDDDHDEDHDEHEEEIPDTGSLENSAAEAKSITGGISYIGKRGFLGVSLHRFESDYGIPGGHEHAHEEEDHDHEDEDDHDDHDEDDDDHDDHDEDHDEDEHHDEAEEADVTIGLRQTRVDLNGGLELDGFIEKLQFFAGIADYTHTEYEGPGVVGTVFSNEGYEGRLEAIQREQNGWAAAYGVQLRQRKFSAIGEEAFVPPTQTNQFGAYMFHEKELGSVHLEGAARYESVSQEDSTTGTDVDFDLLSVSAGGDVHLSETVRVGGTVFRTERAPTTEELFSDGPHLATSQFEKGDATLGKETATGIEAAIRHRENGHFVTMNAFYTDYDDYVYEFETGLEEDGLDVFQFVGEDAKFYGFEVQAGADIGKVSGFDVSVDGLAEYVRAKTDSGNIPRIPPLSVLTGLEAENDRVKLRAELDYAAKQTKISTTELPTSDYGLVNLFATWKSPAGAQNVRLKLSVMNLLDSEARQHTSFLKDVVPLPGRNVRFSISTQF